MGDVRTLGELLTDAGGFADIQLLLNDHGFGYLLDLPLIGPAHAPVVLDGVTVTELDRAAWIAYECARDGGETSEGIARARWDAGRYVHENYRKQIAAIRTAILDTIGVAIGGKRDE